VTEVLPVLAALTGAAAVVVKLPLVLRRSQLSVPARHFVAGVLLLALALPVQVGPVEAWMTVDGLKSAWPVQHVLGTVAAYLVQAGFVHAVEADRERAARLLCPRLLLMWLAVAVMIITFALEPRASDWLFSPGGRFWTGEPGSPIAAWAYVAFGSYFAYSVSTLFLLSRRWARMAGARGPQGRLLATGLRIHAFGEVPLFAYAVHMSGYNLTILLGTNPPWPEAVIDYVLKSSGAVVVLVGLSVSAIPLVTASSPWLAVSDRLSPVVDRWRFERARRGVHPLWTQVTAVIPQVAYQQLAAPWRSGSPRSHAYRTVVELRDALTLLCQLSTNRLRVAQIAQHAAERGRASGLTGDDLSAVVAASIISAGLPAWGDGGRPDSGTPADPPVTSALTLIDELRWWRAVAKAMTTSPVVREALERTQACSSSTAAS
jgi:hypothetical protein